MVSCLTHIMGSPAYSIRNRAEIFCGDHHASSHSVTWARELRDLGAGSLTGALMCPPRPVSAVAAVAGHLPRHRGRRLAQPDRDHGERLTGVQAEADLFPVGQFQPSRSRDPPVLPDRAREAARAISVTA